MKTSSLLGLVTSLMFAGALLAPAAEAPPLDTQVQDAIRLFQKTDPKMQRLFDTAYGYVVFPSVGKAAVGIGGAGGRGLVFEKGQMIGEAKMTQVTVGAQLGGQTFVEVIFFESPAGLDDFRAGKTALAAGLSAVAAADGASAEAKYQQGVLVFTMAKNGLMFQASVGGQHFNFSPMVTVTRPAKEVATTPAPTGDSAVPPPAQPTTY